MKCILAGIDLNLLPVLAALLRRRNVTHAATEAGLSQPAMSRALGRLRGLLDDALLVRGSRGYVLTPRAAELLPVLEALLGGVQGMLRPEAFDPAVVTRTIRVAASDSHAILLMPAVAARLAVEAPGIDLRIESYSVDLRARMESGALDLAFATTTTPLPPGTMSAPLLRDRLALVMRQGHPAAGRDWSIADYGEWGHAGIALLGDGQSELDALLAAAGVRRRMVVVTPHFTAALAMVAATDLVTTISEAFALRFAEAFGLVVKAAPFEAVGLDVTMVWSHVRDGDPVLRWFRGVLGDVAKLRLE